MAVRNTFDTEKRTCDRCGFDHKKSSLRKQRGLWLGHDCFDNVDKLQEPRTRWQQSRSDSNTVTIPAESTPQVFVVTAAGGVSLISQSNKEVDHRDGRHKSFFMKIVSDGGPITISANPQIVAAAIEGDLLTLQGTSDTDTVTITDDNGIRTIGGRSAVGLPFTLGDGDTISFVYTQIDAGWGATEWGVDWGHGAQTFIPIWRETSRFKGGL